MIDFSKTKKPDHATALIMLEDGTLHWGRGFGAATDQVGEICFNTSMTGYQEVLTDPSYTGQIVTFTFPHIGNVGTNEEDNESLPPTAAAQGLIVREDVTAPSSWRAAAHLNDWLCERGLPGIGGIDTRALTRRIRDHGAPRGLIAHHPNGEFDLNALYQKVQDWPGLEGLDLAITVSTKSPYEWQETLWRGEEPKTKKHVVAIDYGAKHNILRCLRAAGCKVTVVPCDMPANDILALRPDGVFLSNGPGDPAATGQYAVPIIKDLLASKKPLFGICLGHQLLALALGGKTAKMKLGHRGANHPVKDMETGKVEITSQNHGFHVDAESLKDAADITHISLFDHSNEGLRAKNHKAFSVQYHPEASPGPQDSHYLFERFVKTL